MRVRIENLAIAIANPLIRPYSLVGSRIAKVPVRGQYLKSELAAQCGDEVAHRHQLPSALEAGEIVGNGGQHHRFVFTRTHFLRGELLVQLGRPVPTRWL